jgi:hypothetical protein
MLELQLTNIFLLNFFFKVVIRVVCVKSNLG